MLRDPQHEDDPTVREAPAAGNPLCQQRSIADGSHWEDRIQGPRNPLSQTRFLQTSAAAIIHQVTQNLRT